jgi:hypothetical protein
MSYNGVLSNQTKTESQDLLMANYIASFLLLIVVLFIPDNPTPVRFALMLPAFAIALGLPLAVRPAHISARTRLERLIGLLSTRAFRRGQSCACALPRVVI